MEKNIVHTIWDERETFIHFAKSVMITEMSDWKTKALLLISPNVKIEELEARFPKYRFSKQEYVDGLTIHQSIVVWKKES